MSRYRRHVRVVTQRDFHNLIMHFLHGSQWSEWATSPTGQVNITGHEAQSQPALTALRSFHRRHHMSRKCREVCRQRPLNNTLLDEQRLNVRQNTPEENTHEPEPTYASQPLATRPPPRHYASTPVASQAATTRSHDNNARISSWYREYFTECHQNNIVGIIITTEWNTEWTELQSHDWMGNRLQ